MRRSARTGHMVGQRWMLLLRYWSLDRPTRKVLRYQRCRCRRCFSNSPMMISRTSGSRNSPTASGCSRPEGLSKEPRLIGAVPPIRYRPVSAARSRCCSPTLPATPSHKLLARGNRRTPQWRVCSGGCRRGKLWRRGRQAYRRQRHGGVRGTGRHDDDPMRAVRAALTIHEQMAMLFEREWPAAPGSYWDRQWPSRRQQHRSRAPGDTPYRGLVNLPARLQERQSGETCSGCLRG